MTTGFRNKSIQFKLTSIIMMTSVLGLLMMAISLISYDRHTAKESLVRELHILAQIIAHRSTAALTFRDQRVAQGNLDALTANKNIILACLYDISHNIFVQYSKVANAECPLDITNEKKNINKVDHQAIHIYETVNLNGSPVGLLYFKGSLTSLNLRVTRFTKIIVWIVLAVSLFALILTSRLQRIISKPILALNSVAKRISEEEDYSIRAAKDSGDELGDLVQTFNGMLDKIQSSQQDLEHMAFYDALTGLPNRRYFYDNLVRLMESVKRKNNSLALFLIDLDGFKNVNDTLGHDAGDLVLKTVSKRLKSCIRKGDIAARLGGDEFTVILDKIVSIYAVRRIARSIINCIEEDIHFKDQLANVSASIGISMAPTDADNTHAFLKCADEAMYTVKESGKRNYFFYNQDIDKVAKAFNDIEMVFFHCLQHQKLLPLYQPIIDFKTRKLKCIHTSVHGNRNDGTIIDFRSVSLHLDETVKIKLLYDQFFNLLEADLKQWHQENILAELPGFAFSVCSQHLQLEHVQKKLCRFLENIKNYKRNFLIFTDHYFFSNQEKTPELLKNIDQLNAQFILEDEGSGHLSTNLMNEYKNQMLAVNFNTEFHHTEEQNEQITESIIRRSNRSGITCICGSINTSEDHKKLSEMGAKWGYGDFLWAPMTVKKFSSWILSNQQDIYAVRNNQ